MKKNNLKYQIDDTGWCVLYFFRKLYLDFVQDFRRGKVTRTTVLYTFFILAYIDGVYNHSLYSLYLFVLLVIGYVSLLRKSGEHRPWYREKKRKKFVKNNS